RRARGAALAEGPAGKRRGARAERDPRRRQRDPAAIGRRTDMDLAHEVTFNARLPPKVQGGDGPLRNRRIREVLGGEVSGERIKGTVGTGGSDGILVGPDGWGRLDVRLTILTDDGAAIYVQYFGVIEYNEAALAANAGERSSEYADHYFRTAPRLE